MLLALVLLPTPATAELRAHFRVEQINSGCWVDDQETFLEGEPDRFWRMAIFDADSSTIFNACAAGCTPDSNPATLDGCTSDYCTTNTGCGVWDFADREIVKVIPNRSGVYFYFGLWDDDVFDESDSLGDHWFFASGPGSGTANNNNVSPYYANNPISSICGETVEEIGDANNFSVTFAVWFVDTTPPSAPGTLYHVDDDLLNTGWDNDTRLDLTWSSGSDVESGIARYNFFLYDTATSSYVIDNQSVGTSLGASVCPSGCTFAYTPVHGHRYRVHVSATNGAYPTISNPLTAYSSSIYFTVDLYSPVTSITSPPSGSWQRTNFSVGISDSDSGSGLLTCEWQVLSNGVETRSWVGRTCNASVGASVGPAGYCRNEGSNTCRVEGRSRDVARRISATAVRYFSIDWTADPVGALLAYTSQGGWPIPESSWTQDRDPYFTWVSSSVAPIVGYSWNLDADPDCTPDTGGGSSYALQLPSGTLGDGTHTFRVRAIDEAGNCGPENSFDVWVDGTPDPVPNLRASGAGGDIFDGVWQRETSVDMLWDPASSISPIEGYSYSTTGVPDCVPDTAMETVLLTGLVQGITTFGVRAVDYAENCGPLNEFDIAVDSAGDTITSLIVLTYPGGEVIDPMTWQADNDPYLAWPVPASTSPIAGYSVDVDQAPDCAAQVAAPEYTFAPDALSNGIHVIQVRAIDEAGNCGDPTVFEIWVNADAGTSPGDILGGLRVSKNDVDPQNLDLSWTASCSGVAIDYSVHEGALGVWYSHAAKECSTGTALSLTITPAQGDRYFLVVPLSWSEEGTYGTNWLGDPRPVSTPACMAVQAPPPHCP